MLNSVSETDAVLWDIHFNIFKWHRRLELKLYELWK